jgi:signal transduction histidine kinase
MKKIQDKLEEHENNHEKRTMDAIRVLAHDLRNSLGGLCGLCALLRNDITRMRMDRIERFVAQMDVATESVLTLLDNLVTWSMLGFAPIEPSFQETDFTAVLQRVNAVVSASFDTKSVTLKKVVDPLTLVSADPTMLFSILQNLLGNALKFSREGDVVTIAAKKYQDEVCFSVSDMGCGMSQERIDMIMANERVESTVGTGGESGVGIGLQLVMTFVRLHNGHISVKSTEGQGTIVRVRLPASQ